MEKQDFVREILAQIIKDEDVDMTWLSRQIGKNKTYIQQYITKGTPKKLDGDLRNAIAKALKKDPSIFATVEIPAMDDDFMEIMAKVDSPRIKARLKDVLLSETMAENAELRKR